MKVFLCETCGGPIDAPWAELVVVCGHCGNHNYPGRPDAPVPPRFPADGRARLNLGGRTYVLLGRIGTGDSTWVYRARWVVRLGELVTLKLLWSRPDADLLRREWDALRALQGSTARGADHYVTRLPAPIAYGPCGDGQARLASVFGWKSGFVHSLEQVGHQYPDGVSGEITVWILKRLLELLGWVHRSGWVHGAVTPSHVLVHPRDHGAMLVGWTVATPWVAGRSQTLPALPAEWAGMYPHQDPARVEATPVLDIQMACRCAEAVGGWLGEAERLVGARSIRRVLDHGLSGAVDDAWALRDELVAASEVAYGPPAYNPLTMPGWTR